MVLHVSDLGSDCSKIRDIPVPRSNDDHEENIGYISTKKHLHSRTEEETFSPNEDNGGDDQDNSELARKKRAKKNNLETEAGSSSSSDYSSFVALVTASNLQRDALYLPQDFTSSNGLKRECREIVLTDEGERAWSLELRFNMFSETFYISRGWRCFCNENAKKAGGFFVFKLVGHGEVPVLSFCPTESCCNRRQRECSEASERKSISTRLISEEDSSEDYSLEIRKKKNHLRECSEASGRKSLSTELISEEESSENEYSSLELEKLKNHLRSRDSAPSSRKQFVTLTLRPFNVLDGRLRLPIKFTRENDINKPGLITLLGKDRIKQQVRLLFHKGSGAMCLGKGWKDFAEANGLKTGVSFTLESIWENATPMLSLFSIESTSDRIQQGECSKASKKEWISTEPSDGNTTKKAKNNIEERDSTSPIQNRFVTLTLTHDSLKRRRLHLPSSFVRENGITRPGMITLLGTNGKKWLASLLQDCKGTMTLGNGWKDFAQANGLKTGLSFTLESVWENASPMLSLFSIESTSDKMQQGECSRASKKEWISTEPSDGKTTKKAKSNREERRDSTSPSQNRFVILKLTHDSLKRGRLHLPSSFVRENGITRPGIITLLGTNGAKWLASLLQDNKGTMTLGNGWKDFAEANGLKTGESFTLESIWEKASPMLSLFGTESTSKKMQEGECSKGSEKESISTEPNSEKQDQEKQGRVEKMSETVN